MVPMTFPERRPFWLPIYTDQATGRLMSTVIQPIFLGTNRSHYYGDQATDVFLSELQSVVSDASSVAGGYAMLIDSTGTLFAADQLTLNVMFCPNGTSSSLSLVAHMCTGANGTFDFAAPNPSYTPIGMMAHASLLLLFFGSSLCCYDIYSHRFVRLWICRHSRLDQFCAFGQWSYHHFRPRVLCGLGKCC
jgi:hypothetical protein